ncbi:hypothetical protein CEXT_29491 [Caerostris extrusa]|uniref:Uncharacterized protein n=1 Tax=Caerostris extrusa TaxID=172846 RepID=A0AAV4XY69_CAEEX|nr:hypothetical protein CEXT_29491 [Caerostris extrusa]
MKGGKERLPTIRLQSRDLPIGGATPELTSFHFGVVKIWKKLSTHPQSLRRDFDIEDTCIAGRTSGARFQEDEVERLMARMNACLSFLLVCSG